RDVDAGLDPGALAAQSERVRTIEEAIERNGGLRTRAGRRELDVGGLLARFGAGAAMADREALEAVVAPQEQRVAEVLAGDGFDFGGEVQSGVDGVGKLAARGQGFGPGLGRERGKGDGLGGVLAAG